MKFTGHERDAMDPFDGDGDLDYMHARFYNPQVGRFTSVDPANSRDPNRPQTWNRYAYASNNPMVRIDPDGQKDRRTAQDVAILEDPDILVAAADMLDQTGLDQPLQNRQEVGAVVAHLGGADYDIEGGIVTDRKLNTVRLEVARSTTGEVVTATGKELAATMHTHPGSGPVKIDGKSVTLLGGGASSKDRQQAQTTSKPVYILNANTSMIRVESVGGKVVTTRILTRKDYKEYLERARQAQQPPTP
jgi:RHS repeat-associated protein